METFSQDTDVSKKFVKAELELQKGIIITSIKEVLKENELKIGNKNLDYIQSNLYNSQFL